MDLQDTTGLLAAVAGAGVLVSGLVAALKAAVFPTAWQHGRAPMIAVAVLSALAVLAFGAQLGLDPGAPATWTAAAAAWLTVYTAAIGAHQTVTKAARVMAGTTDTAGEDATATERGPDA